MYTLLIADDERIMVEGIKTSIDWASYDIEVAGIAYNGNEALEKAKELKPDIILTDIRMPGITGIEMIKQLKAIKQDAKVIVISAYEQFEYAQAAINLGVLSYLTKPLKKQNILDEVIKARDIIAKEREEKESLRRLEKLYERNIPILREHYLNSMMMGSIKVSGNLISQFDIYKIDLGCKNTGVFVCSIDNIEEAADEFFEKSIQMLNLILIDTINHTLPSDISRVTFQSYNNEIVTVYSLNGRYEDSEEQIKEYSRRIKDNYFNETETSISIGVGCIYEDISDISRSYHEASKALNYREVRGHNTVISFNEIENSEKSQSFVLEDLNDILVSIERGITSCDSKEVLHYVGDITARLKSSKVPFYYVQQVYCQLVSVLLRTIFDMSIKPEQIYSANSDLYIELFKYKSFDELDKWYKKIIVNTCNILSKNNESRMNSVINRAIEYMQNHCGEDITLLDVAEHVSFNHQYFSRLFKEETGVQFIEYMKKLKIEKAKELLKNSNKKVYEICDELGYQSVQYFSTLFKSVTGMTPHEYKTKG
jgi:two-component system response regulator YesN